MRITVIRKMSPALFSVLCLVLLSAAGIFNRLEDLKKVLHSVTDADQPISAAAPKVEIDTIGSGMAAPSS